MEFRSVLLASLPLLAAVLAHRPSEAASLPSATLPQDGYLSRKLLILVYPADAGFDSSPRGWILRREISLFEGYLWRYSDRRLAVDTRCSILHRSLRPEEFRDYGERFGFLLDRSSQVEADIQSLGEDPSSLVLLYDAPPG